MGLHISQLSKLLDLTTVGLSTGATQAVDLDLANCDGALLIGVPASTAARTWAMSFKSGATTTGLVSCASTHTITSTGVRNDVLVKDIYKPAKRFIQATFGSSTATPMYLLCFKYSLRKPTVTFSCTANVPVANGGISRSISPTSAT